MFFDWKGIMLTLAVLGAVVIFCSVDLCCSPKPGATSAIARVKGELASGREADKSRQLEHLTLALRDMRVLAKRYVREGDRENARRAMAAARELEQKIREL